MTNSLNLQMSIDEAKEIRKALYTKMTVLEDKGRDNTEEYAKYESLYKWFVELTWEAAKEI